jgi:hypothetical protein
VALEEAITYHAEADGRRSLYEVRGFAGGWQRNGMRSRITKSILAIKGSVPGASCTPD